MFLFSCIGSQLLSIVTVADHSCRSFAALLVYMRWFWKWYLWSEGWKIEGALPPELKKAVIVVAPHTHWLDFVVGLAVRSVMRMTHVKFLGKAELFKPPFGFLFKWLGGTPVDRSGSHQLVDAVVAKFDATDELVLALSPEGTRKRVDRLRTGFYYIARRSAVPIVMAALDFENKRVIFAPPFMPTENDAADIERILAFFRPVKGKLPQQGLGHL